MANYAVGDLQGCYEELSNLLKIISYSPTKDKLWFTGDLINRGPESLKCLDFIYSNRDNCNIVLGNHDLHFLAVAEEIKLPNKNDTLEALLTSKRKNLYVEWMTSLPLIHIETLKTNKGLIEFIMSHAGIPPHWKLEEAKKASNNIEKFLNNKLTRKVFFNQMYGNHPTKYEDNISEMELLRLNTNYLTRMRICSSKYELNLSFKGSPNDCPKNFKPWFDYDLKILNKNRHLLFGHWAALRGETNKKNISALDAGCVWGNYLKAIRLEDGREFRSNAVN